MIWFWMGESSSIQDKRPPSFPFLTQAGVRTLSGYLHVGANYELVTDNLLDLSHAEFLHPFIAPRGTASSIAYRVEVEGDRVSALHSMRGQPNTPLFGLLIGDEVKLIDLMRVHESTASEKGKHLISMDAYGYRWFRAGDLSHLLSRKTT